MAGNQLKTVLMNFQKQANYRERKEKAAAGSLKDKGNKATKKIQDKLRYLRKKSLVMENKQKQAKEEHNKQLEVNKKVLDLELKALKLQQSLVEDQLNCMIVAKKKNNGFYSDNERKETCILI